MLVEVFHKKNAKSSGSHLRARRSLISDMDETEQDQNEYLSYFEKFIKRDKSFNNRELETEEAVGIHTSYNRGMNVVMEQCSFFVSLF